MVSSSVNSVSFFQTSTSSAKAVSSSTDDSFSKVMNERIQKTDISTDTEDIGRDETYAKEKDDVEKVDTVESEKAQEDSKVENTEETTKDSNDIKDFEKTEENITDEIEEMKELPEEEMLAVVASVLNISVEELKVAMSELGMNCEDLLSGEGVTKLVMDLEDIENKFELLVHADANDTIKDVSKAVEEFLSQISEETDVNVESEIINQVEVDTEDEILVSQENLKAETEKPEVDTEQVEVETDETEISDVNNTKNTVVETETNQPKENQTSMSGNGNAEENVEAEVKPENEILNNVAEFKDNVLNEIEGALNDRVSDDISTRIIREISDNIRVAARNNVTTMEMQLYPEHLGKVTIQLVAKDGGITARISAETEMAKNAIEQQLTLLKENLNQQDVRIEEIEVTIASHGFEQNLDGSNRNDEQAESERNGRARRGFLDELNDEGEEEVAESETVKRALGSTVSYLA